MAQGCSSQARTNPGFDADPHVEMMEGLRCKCEKSWMREDYTFTARTCSKIGKATQYCWGKAQDYCETGDKSHDFRYYCAQRGPDCWVESC